MGHVSILLDEMGLDKMGLDEMGINLRGKWKLKYGNGNTEVRRKADSQWPNVPCRQRVTL